MNCTHCHNSTVATTPHAHTLCLFTYLLLYHKHQASHLSLNSFKNFDVLGSPICTASVTANSCMLTWTCPLKNVLKFEDFGVLNNIFFTMGGLKHLVLCISGLPWRLYFNPSLPPLRGSNTACHLVTGGHAPMSDMTCVVGIELHSPFHSVVWCSQ